MAQNEYVLRVLQTKESGPFCCPELREDGMAGPTAPLGTLQFVSVNITSYPSQTLSTKHHHTESGPGRPAGIAHGVGPATTVVDAGVIQSRISLAPESSFMPPGATRADETTTDAEEADSSSLDRDLCFLTTRQNLTDLVDEIVHKKLNQPLAQSLGLPSAGRPAVGHAREAQAPSTTPLNGDNVGAEEHRGEGLVPNPQRPVFSARNLFGEPVPEYEVPVVKRRGRLEMRGAMLLGSNVKAIFYNDLDLILGRWGVSRAHRASCVLIPHPWKDRKAEEMLKTVLSTRKPPAGKGRSTHKIHGHTTQLARFIAWFSRDWHRGIDLDQFVDRGTWQSMDSSHLCHHADCINPNHIVYEPAAMNAARYRCHRKARSDRQNSIGIGMECDIHTPPCLLQLAALQRLETYAIQFSTYLVACGRGGTRDNELRGLRPGNHHTPFEISLPLGLPLGRPTLGLDYNALVFAALDTIPGRILPPVLCCQLCLDGPAGDCKSRKVAAFWAHILRSHADEPLEWRLSQIRTAAEKWNRYWVDTRRIPGPNDRTRRRISRALSGELTWRDVEGWGLEKMRCV